MLQRTQRKDMWKVGVADQLQSQGGKEMFSIPQLSFNVDIRV